MALFFDCPRPARCERERCGTMFRGEVAQQEEAVVRVPIRTRTSSARRRSRIEERRRPHGQMK